MGTITVLLPTFNRRQWLQRAVESVIQETRIPILLRIFDNASTDDTEPYVRELMSSDPRVNYTRNPENIGGVANYTKAFDSIDTEYFVPLADDDWLYPDFLFTAYQRMEQEKDLGAVIFMTDARNEAGTSVINSSQPPERILEGYLDSESHLREWLKFGHYISWSSILWRSKTLELTPRPFFKIGLPFDVDFQMRVFSNYPVYLFNKLGAVYLLHENQSSNGFNIFQLRAWATIFNTLDYFRDKHLFFEDEEYIALRKTMVNRYHELWNRPSEKKLTEDQMISSAVVSAYRLGDWQLAYKLIDETSESSSESNHRRSKYSVLSPMGDSAHSAKEKELLSRIRGLIPTTIAWYHILSDRNTALRDQNATQCDQNAALRSRLAQIEIELEQLKLNRKTQKGLINNLGNELTQAVKKMQRATGQLYGTCQWKWGAFFVSPFNRKDKKIFPSLDHAISDMTRLTSTLKTLNNSKPLEKAK